METTSLLFQDLYRQQGPALFRLALGLTGREEEAEDLVQETFCKAMAAFGSFRHESSFSTWLFRICVNAGKDRLRQRKRLPVQIFTEDFGIPMEEMVEADPGEDPLVLALAEDIRMRCLHCFTECLPRRQRQVFCLSHVLGLDQKTIAGILGCGVGAVKASLFRARRRIDGYLNDRCDLIRPENPCDCRQWVRFGLRRGIIRPPSGASPGERQDRLNAKAARVRREIGSILEVRRLYFQSFSVRAEEAFARRLGEGIRKKEWAWL